ncbi:fasciclin domain-containing protein [Massilia niastensis]|uniref:fasciclin domain-containing protein n=1 Tax=Massilia niastensis TaxID=544911 RepID=UPI0004757E75|nr:fasciclin domain-containing protein [Massilia niastensis]
MKKFWFVMAVTLSCGGAQAADIVDTAKSAGNFTTLVKAVAAAGMIDTLKGPGPFTVFAPTDEAFAKLPKAKLDSLMKDKAALAKVLAYHVVPSKVMASNIKPGSVMSVQGSPLSFNINGSKVHVDKATVVSADVAADNGVIHAIDTVLMPK